jgi:hypothetical protein
MYDVRKNRLYILICIAHFLHWCVCQHNFPKLKQISLTDQKWSIPFYAFWGVVPWNIQRPRSAWHRPSSYHTSNPARCSRGIADIRGCSQVIEKVSTLLHNVAHVSSCFIMFLCSVSFCCTKRSKQVMSCHVYTITVSWWITIYLDLHLCFAILL